jgi:type III secretion protein R
MKPLEEFLKKFSFPREREFFTKRPDGSQRTESVFTLIPAFLLSELSRAFSIGVMVFLPFLVIDLVVTNLLIALGMTMTNPMTITFPVKLLLFVASDGWFLLCRSLILSYR